jgi:hypothetical protein
MNLEDYVKFQAIPYGRVIRGRGTPFLTASKTILTGPPTTLFVNYPWSYNPWSYLSLDTKRILVIPDENVMRLSFGEIYIYFSGGCKLQVVVGRCPRAAGSLERAQKYASESQGVLEEEFLEYLILSEYIGRGPLTYISPFTFGSSSTGWRSLWHVIYERLFQRISGHREVTNVLTVQVSTDLIGDRHDIEQRKEVARRIVRECHVPIILSYPRAYYYESWVVEPVDAKEWVNEVLVFFEYLYSAPRSDLFRQPSDLKRILNTFGGTAYLMSTVMNAEEFSKFMKDLKAKFLSPIPISIDYGDPCVLLSLNPSKGMAERYGNDFKSAFKNAEVIATYEEKLTGGESRFVIGVPIYQDGLEKCLSQVGVKEYRG